MKRIVMFLFAVVVSAAYSYVAYSGELPDWQNPELVQRNRLPMSATFDAGGLKCPLNGVWNFRWYESIEARDKGFWTESYDDSNWDRMPVPGMWELNGYGFPVYKNIGWAWQGQYRNNPPFPALWHNYAGQYRREFVLDDQWKGKDVFLPSAQTS